MKIISAQVYEPSCDGTNLPPRVEMLVRNFDPTEYTEEEILHLGWSVNKYRDAPVFRVRDEQSGNIVDANSVNLMMMLDEVSVNILGEECLFPVTILAMRDRFWSEYLAPISWLDLHVMPLIKDWSIEIDRFMAIGGRIRFSLRRWGVRDQEKPVSLEQSCPLIIDAEDASG